MQVFITDENLAISAQNLDDLRLNKQITEINQILLTYINDGGGHANHPVNQWYKSSQGILYLLKYLYRLCDEYSYRFKKYPMGYFTYGGLCDDLLNADGVPCKDTYGDNLLFTPAYIKGQKNKDQIITTENVYELYRKLLCNKWDNDLKYPKWTNRNKPKWYKEK